MEAWLAFLRGDVPRSLAAFRPTKLPLILDGRLRGEASLHVATVYLAAGLASEAVEVLTSLDTQTIPETLAVEKDALLARALLIQGSLADARDLSTRASQELRRMGRRIEGAEAELVALQGESLTAPADDLASRTEKVAAELKTYHSRNAVEAWLLAGAVAAEAGKRPRALRAYSAAATERASTDLLVAASGWLGRAHQVELQGAPRVLRACSRGLDALDEYADIMGSSEVRASITHRGRDLAAMALRHSAHNPRSLLAWSERWRATSLAQRPVTPHGDVSPAVAMLRNSGRLLAEARAAGESTLALEKERRSLERRVRAEHHQQRAEGKTETKRFDPAELVAQIDDGAFIELVDVDGSLHVLVVSKGRVRRVIAGETKAALELAEAGRFALRRAARTSRFAPGDLGERFQDAVLGKAVRMLPDGPVTISPTAALHGAPFALMPALATRPFSIVPSAAQWLRAREVPTPRTKRRAFVSGPGLLTGGAEVARLATQYPDATVLRDADATVAATMKAIDGAKLAHLATHGTFRADSPLFSALEMADGQLSVYELERLKRAPYRTILSACDSGVLAPVGAQEVLGLASALFSLGSAGLLCSIAEVNDEATADLMVRVHAALDAKRTPAEALAEVRVEGSPVEQATAAAFVALGV
ncbi:MAG: CHAT domain-containing protein [Marmoricola sp.]